MNTQLKIEKVRKDIIRILNRYKVTLPEVIGVYRQEEDEDEKIWKKIEPTYRRVQEKVFKEMYPTLVSKKKKKR